MTEIESPPLSSSTAYVVGVESFWPDEHSSGLITVDLTRSAVTIMRDDSFD
jgi:hypothetical protein